MPNALRSMIYKSTALLEKCAIESKPDSKLKTSAASLKFGVDSLIENLKKTVRNKFN